MFIFRTLSPFYWKTKLRQFGTYTVIIAMFFGCIYFLHTHYNFTLHWYAVEMMESCVVPTLDWTYFLLGKLVLVNLIFNFLSRQCGKYHNLYHILSCIFGLILLYGLLPNVLPIFVAIFFIMYTILTICYYIYHWSNNKYLKSTLFGELSILSVIVAFEFLMKDQDLWNQSRGVAMIQTMKFISLIFMFDHESYPKLLECLGYIFFPPNIMFGPWIPFITYQTGRFYPIKKKLLWVSRMVVCAVAVLSNLLISKCLTQPFIQEDVNKWLTAYFKALSYRTSHYFISYLSEFSLVTAGFKDFITRIEDGWGYTVTKPFKIELPTSLKSVIINWDIPMQLFLKEFVYRPWIHHGKLVALTLIFVISLILHGINKPNTLILFSIGLSWIVEYKFRAALSNLFNACVGVDQCVECHHLHSRNSIPSKTINLIFSLVTTIYLVYFGSVMDLGLRAPISKYIRHWKSLNFIGHYITILMLLTVIFR